MNAPRIIPARPMGHADILPLIREVGSRLSARSTMRRFSSGLDATSQSYKATVTRLIARLESTVAN